MDIGDIVIIRSIIKNCKRKYVTNGNSLIIKDIMAHF